MYLDIVSQKINIPFYANLQTDILGMDSKQHCLNAELFNAWPLITYQFNQVGFRTHSIDKFDPNAVLVLGDSFTLGLGVNSADRFSDIIEQRIKHQVLNFSLNGASNDWMARKIKRLVEVIAPKTIIVQWSYFCRRESPIGNSDEEKKLPYTLHNYETSDDADIENFKNCVLQTKQISKNCQIINSIIPDAFPGISLTEIRSWWYNDRQSHWPQTLPALSTDISTDVLEQLKKKQQ